MILRKNIYFCGLSQRENHIDMNPMYGLIGFPLSHSFSEKYFSEKFEKEELKWHSYKNFPIADIAYLEQLLDEFPELHGFNVTIPFKKQIISFLDEMDDVAENVGAVNTVQIIRSEMDPYLIGYNTDVYGFSQSLKEWFTTCNADLPRRALVLGTGGASEAVKYSLSGLGMVVHSVSRYAYQDVYKTYDQLNAADIADHLLIVNTSPLGMYPNTDECPAIPYQFLTKKHHLYDLIYNPEKTLFMQKGIERGASVLNGERMLHLQADKAWEIWNSFELRKRIKN